MLRAVLVIVVCLSAAAIAGCHSGGEASRDSGLADSALDASGSDGGQGDADADADGDADNDGDADADAGFDSGPDPCQDASPPDCVTFVNGTKPDSGNGMSWGNAFTEVQDGIDWAYQLTRLDGGPSHCEVWVAQGVYNIFKSSQKDTIVLRPGVDLYGGFSGKEMLRCERDIYKYQSILDGHSEESEMDAGPYPSLNRTYHVMTGSSRALVDGFIVRHGNSTSDPEDYYGGGILNLDSSPRLVNTTFLENEGYAIGNHNGYPTIQSCRFRSNYGAVINPSWSSLWPSSGNRVEISDSLFSHNHSDQGGALWGNDFEIVNSVFFGNACSDDGGAIHTGGNVNIVNSVFVDNFIDNPGPYIPGHGGAIAVGFTGTGGSVMVNNSIFLDNGWMDIEVKEGINPFPLRDVEVYNSIIKTWNTKNGNMADDPQFVDEKRMDFHLLSTSPCIDKADDAKAPPTDIEGHTRVDIPGVGTPGVKADVGAYEYVPKKR